MVEEYRPAWCPHVVGRIGEREFVDGLPEPQDVDVQCEKCGARWRTSCASGQPRSLVARFAARHAHVDPLAAERVVRPGSLRRGGRDA